MWATPEVQARNKRGTRWKRIVMLLAGTQAEEVARMVNANETDEAIASHIARVYRPAILAADLTGSRTPQTASLRSREDA